LLTLLLLALTVAAAGVYWRVRASGRAAGPVAPAVEGREAGYVKERQPDKAADSKAIAAGPAGVQAYYHLGKTYAREGKTDKAIDNYSKAIALDPKYARAYLARGSAWHLKGERGRAMEDYSMALELDPELAEAYYARARAYLESGENAKAKDDEAKYRLLSGK